MSMALKTEVYCAKTQLGLATMKYDYCLLSFGSICHIYSFIIIIDTFS